MPKAIACILSLILVSQPCLFAQGGSFKQIRYNGGTVPTQIKPDDWGNSLIIGSDLVTLWLKNGQRIDIRPDKVTSLTYGQEAHRRVGTMVALSILVAPLALVGLFHKTRLHYIGIQFTKPDGNESGGVLLQGHKDNYRAVLFALQSVTRQPVSIAEEDRKFVPVGVLTATAAAQQNGQQR